MGGLPQRKMFANGVIEQMVADSRKITACKKKTGHIKSKTSKVSDMDGQKVRFWKCKRCPVWSFAEILTGSLKAVPTNGNYADKTK